MSRRKVVAAVLVACVLSAGGTIVAFKALEDESVTDPHATVIALRSSVLAEEREVIVHLPVSYESERARRYPVLYVLDGGSQSTHTAESARLLHRIGLMPEVLVVGIPNSSDENRQRDYTPPYIGAGDEGGPAGKADRFLMFLERELIPMVDRKYRTTPERMLAGNSRGGLFVVYSLIERPSLFTARFAFSPALWRDDDRIVKELEHALPGGAPAFLYLSLGDGENEKMTRAFRKTSDILRAHASPSLRWRVDITKGAVHGDNARLSTPVGLCELYRER